MGNTAIDRILKPSLGLVGDGDGGFGAVTDWKVGKELGDIACTKDLMNG